jgi:cation transport regulator
MPWTSIDDLPQTLRERLPVHGQEIFLAAFNAAWRQHAQEPEVEATAHRIAWAAVKHRYRKSGDVWVARR